MNCLHCGSSNRPEAKFCTQCGKLLPPTPAAPPQDTVCVQCGAPLAASSRFCSQCGKPLIRGEVVRPGPAQTAAREPPELSVAQELAQLGLPTGYGLPPRRGHEVAVSYLRSSVALGHAQVRAGMPQQAIEVTTQLLEDRRLQRLGYKPLMAAAYCVRGLAFERQGNRAAARADYSNALRLAKVPLAQAALKRVR